MPLANISEVKASLVDCLEYCKTHDDADFCKRYAAQMAVVSAELEESWATTDRYFAQWRREAGIDKLSWKDIAKLLREVQDRLKRIDAIDYPDRRVMYWDKAILEVAARQMMDYLAEHSEAIDFADEYLNKFVTLLDTAHNEHGQSAGALRSYQQHFQSRRVSLSNAYYVIGEFRDAMRAHFGKDHPDYQGIRWAWSVSPDESVL